MKKFYLLLVVFAMALTTLAACRGGRDEVDRFLIPEGHPLEMLAEAMAHFPEYGDTGLPHMEGTIFQRGVAEANPWAGVIGGGGLFTMAAIDGLFADLLGTSGGLIAMNEFEQFGEGGVVSVEHCVDTRTLVLTQDYEVFWHDGVPLTLYDLYFTFHVLAHPDHRGPRHFRSLQNAEIVGIWEFNNYHRVRNDPDVRAELAEQAAEDPDNPRFQIASQGNSIEGLVLSNDNLTLTIYFNDFPPTLLYFGIWTSPMPAHIFGAYWPNNVADMIDSPAVRENPIGWGPFVFVHSEPGESFLFRRNENYVWGAPYIEYKVLRRIAPDMIADAMVAGEFDSVGFRTMDFEHHQNPTNFRFFGAPNRARQAHFAFRMGWWCFDTNQNVSEMVFADDHPTRAGEQRYHEMMRPEAWYIRKAMAMAIDWMTLTQVRNHGLAFPAGAYIPLRHRALMDLTVPMFRFDPAEANQILDDAGFTNRDAEGYRTWLDGERMELIWLAMEGPEAEFYYQHHTQAWRDIGIRVSLYDGTFHSQWTIWDLMDYDAEDDEVHFWTGAWNHGASPSNSMWARGEFENASRHASEEWDAILDRVNSMAAWDTEYLIDAMSELQWYKYNTIFYFPSTWGIGLTAVNNRVANWDTRVTTLTRDHGWHTIRLTAAEPYSG